ncbi:MAG: formate dehydrogenase accessory sulfurtransferase FdhD [Myxococcota bacterium]
MATAIRQRRRLGAQGLGTADDDLVVAEAPLTIRVAGERIATTMRTPGDDAALALGFLAAEGVIRRPSDVGRVASCGAVDAAGVPSAVDVTPGPGVFLDVSAVRRSTLVSSACGVCGHEAIEALAARLAPLDAPALDAALLLRAAAALEGVQPDFARTGGAHAAVIVDAFGEVVAAAEDVGRHNAVDKAVGRRLQDGALGRGRLLVVSSRSSYEIVQKAVAARLDAIVAVGAPTSLAIDLATHFGAVLGGFARAGTLNVYAGAERLLVRAGA